MDGPYNLNYIYMETCPTLTIHLHHHHTCILPAQPYPVKSVYWEVGGFRESPVDEPVLVLAVYAGQAGPHQAAVVLSLVPARVLVRVEVQAVTDRYIHSVCYCRGTILEELWTRSSAMFFVFLSPTY